MPLPLVNNTVRSSLLSSDGTEYPQRTMVWSGSPIVDACAVHADYGHLLVLTSDGALHGVDFDAGVCTTLSVVGLANIPVADSDNQHFGAAKHRLHATPDGRFSAIVVDFGRDGVVVDVRSGVVTMRLNGGDYHEDTVPFSACFLRHAGRDVFVHRTAWNRLDAADPVTGESLTERYIAPYVSGGPQPAHYLDYFHGQLRPSPDSSRLFDDGWVWHPSSVPRVWSVTEWLTANPWESEDGSTIIDLTMRNDWTTPACWISNTHIALWGLAEWDTEEFDEVGQGPGVRIFDATESKQSLDGRWPMAIDAKLVRELLSDGARLCVATDSGTTVWDIATRVQIADFDGFVAHLFDAQRCRLAAIAPNAIVELALS